MHKVITVFAVLVFFSQVFSMEKNAQVHEVPAPIYRAFTTDDQEVEISRAIIDQSRILADMFKDMASDSGQMFPVHATYDIFTLFVKLACIADEYTSNQSALWARLNAELTSLSLENHAHLLNAIDYLDCPLILEVALLSFVGKLNFLTSNDTQQSRELLVLLENILSQDLKKPIKEIFLVDCGPLKRLWITPHRPVFFDEQSAFYRPAGDRSVQVQKLFNSQATFMVVTSRVPAFGFRISLFDLRHQNAVKVGEYQGTDYFFSPNGNNLCIDEFLGVAVVNLETQKLVRLQLPYLHTKPIEAMYFSSDSSHLIVKGRPFSVETGIQSDIIQDASSYSEPMDIKEHEAKIEGLRPLYIASEAALLWDTRDLTSISKLSRFGSLKKIPLPQWQQKIGNMFCSSRGRWLFRYEYQGYGNISKLNIIDLEDVENPKTFWGGDVLNSDGSLGLKSSSQDAVCVVTTEDLILITKKGFLKKIKKPSYERRAGSEAIQFNSAGNRLLVRYDDGSAYLYINVEGSAPLRALKVPAEEYKSVDFAGNFLIGQTQTDLLGWKVDFDKYSACSFAQLFMLIKRGQGNPLEEEYYDHLTDSLPSDVAGLLRGSKWI
jgi:hypothetical protein